MTLSIRARLTVWYTAVLTLVLAAAAAGFYLMHARARLARVDEELARGADLIARGLARELDEGADLPEAAREAMGDLDVPGRSAAVLDARGTVLAGRWDGLPRPSAVEATGGAAIAQTAEGAQRVYLTGHRYRRAAYLVGVAEPLRALERELAALRRTLLTSVALALLLAAAGGWWIARAALRPVSQMAGQARAITARTAGARLTSTHPHDELGALAGAFNDLLGRLEAALAQQRQFMADASHELRTPVSVARTAIDVALARPTRPEEEYRDSLAVLGRQMRRLGRIVEDMFLLARADAAGLSLQRGPLYLDELVADCMEETAVLAAPKGVGLDWDGARDVDASGDEQRLRQMLMNLLDNAVRHTPSGGRVRVELVAQNGAAELAVTDGGPGIPDHERERIFLRFVRLDASRGADEGAGLGLPIARAIAEAHGGTLILARSDASGSTFTVRLPRA
jgi:heavy metal sensor kinase